MANNVAPSKPMGKIQTKNLLQKIVSREYVLIIGDDVILKKEFHEGQVENLINDTIEEIKEKDNNFKEYYPDKGNQRYKALSDYIEYSLDDINLDLINLIETKCFPVVITTSVTPYVQLLMEKVWGKDELVVQSIYSAPNDLIVEGYEFGIKPVLYYAFGCCVDGDFVNDENDMMIALSKWIERQPQKFMAYVWSKDTLSIGCTFEDWYFRFFWFTMKGAVLNTANLKKGRIALTLEEEQEENLRKYLFRINSLTVDYNARESLENYSRLVATSNSENSEIKRYQQIISGRRMGGVFISYAHEDFDFAEKLFYKLKKHGIDVWLDNDKLPYADNVGYRNHIENALKQASVFMPIFSDHTISDLKNNKTDRFYLRDEWKKVPDNCKIAPVCIGRYKAVDNDYHQKLKQMIPDFDAKIGQVYYANSDSSEADFNKFINDLKKK